MIFSQLLIAAFLVYWLVERYDNEKTQLRKDLLREFESSEQMMFDTMIRIKLLNPVILNNSTGKNKLALVKTGIGNSTVTITKSSESESNTTVKQIKMIPLN